MPNRAPQAMALSLFFVIVIYMTKNIVELIARLAQSAERKALNLVVVGSSPTVGDKVSIARFLCFSG